MLPFAFSVPHSDLKFCPYLISELFVYFSVSLNKTVNSLKLETESNPALYLENQVWYLALCSINYWIVKDYFFFHLWLDGSSSVCLFSGNRRIWPVLFLLTSSSQISPTPPACFVEFGVCSFLSQSKLLAVFRFLFPILTCYLSRLLYPLRSILANTFRVCECI